MIDRDIYNEVGKERAFLLQCGYQPADLECHFSHEEWHALIRNWSHEFPRQREEGQPERLFMGMPVTLHDERKQGMVRLRIGTPPVHDWMRP